MERITHLFAAALSAALLVAPSVLYAADLYVSPKGSDSNPGTSPDRPLQTLQKADSLVQPGDTVFVMAGIYRNAQTDKGGGSSALLRITRSGTPDKWVTWKAYKGDKPELIAQGCWHGIEIQASYVAVEGLTLTGNNDNVRLADAERNGEVNVKATYAAWRAEGSMSGAADFSATPNLDKPGATAAKAPAKPKSRPVTYEPPSPLYNGNGITVDCRGSKPFVHHIRLKDLVVRKFGGGGIALIDTDYYTVEDCEIYDNAWYSRYGCSGISQLGGKGFDEAPGYHNVIRGNRVYNNKGLVRVYYLGLGLISDGNGIILDSLNDYPGAALVENNLSYGNGGAGIHVFKSRKARIDIVNNTVWGNQQNWKLYDMGAHDAVGVTFLNNVVVADRYRQVNGKAVPGITYDYNVYWGSNLIDAKGPNDLVADPLFAVPTTNRRDGDFRLLPGSPARGTGAKAPVTPAVDMEGKPRGEKPTRGAFEG